MIWPLQIKQVCDPTGDDVGQLTRHRVFIHPGCSVQHGFGKTLDVDFGKTVLFGKVRHVVGPHTDVGQVAVFTAQRIGEDHAGSGAVNVVGFAIVAGVLNGVR